MGDVLMEQNQPPHYEQLDTRVLKGKFGRRAFLKILLFSASAGVMTGGATYLVGTYVNEKFLDVVSYVEGEVRELAANIHALSGSLEAKLHAEKKELEQHYEHGQLKIFEGLGIATPEELSEFEQILNNVEQFEEHYKLAERITIFKDRVKHQITEMEAAGEKKISEIPLIGNLFDTVNDGIRSLYGKPTGADGAQYRASLRDKLSALTSIYDANEDNLIAQAKVLEKINDYLNSTDLSGVEREFYTELKKVAGNRYSPDQFKEMVFSIDRQSGENYALSMVESTLNTLEDTYKKIQEDKAYLQTLQKTLQEGITYKEQVRAMAKEQVSARKEKIDAMIGELRATVDTVISSLENKGYSIDTKEEKISRRDITEFMKPISGYVLTIASAVIGVVAMGYTGLLLFKQRKTIALRDALNDTVDQFNGLVVNYNSLIDRASDQSAKTNAK